MAATVAAAAALGGGLRMEMNTKMSGQEGSGRSAARSRAAGQ